MREPLTYPMSKTKPDAPRELTREEIEEAQKRLVKRKKIHSTVICQEMADMLPRALAGCSALLDLRERIEQEADDQRYKYDRWKRDRTADEATMHAAWHTSVVLRALLAETLDRPTEETNG
jgi:hypothetical protein